MKVLYRPEIDGLRAIAVGIVILYHSNLSLSGYQPFKGGFIGVDIFFIISGYLITSIILKELIYTGSFSYKLFYERRVRRLLPALFVVMLASLPFGWIYLLPESLLDFAKSLLATLGLSSNIYFHNSGLEYAVNGLKNPFLHTWSLSVEAQFYILFPIIIVFIFKYFKKFFLHIIIIFFIFSLVLAEWSSKNYPSVNFYFLHTRMWELLAGSILSFLEIKLGRRNKIKILNLILPLLGLVLIIYSTLFFDDEMYHPSFFSLLPITGVCLIIWFSDKDQFLTKILSTKLFVGTGLISYSLYLWHYPIFSFFSKMSFIDGGIFTKFIIILIVFLSSIISYYFIEKPFRNKNINFNKLSLLLLIKFSLILVFCIYVMTLKFHSFLSKYKDEHRNFEKNYNYQNFDSRKNIFIIGNSYADDLLNLFDYNKELNKEYYFYTALADEKGSNFNIDCLLDFLEKNKEICNKVIFSYFKTQYEKADYIIFTEQLSPRYLKINLNKITSILEKDNKKILVFLDDINNADILDKFIYKQQKLPDLVYLSSLEKKLYEKKLKNKKTFKLLANTKKELLENGITFIERSQLYCEHNNKICPLIRNKDKIYSDEGHLTSNGAKYFSPKAQIILEILINK